MVLNLGFYVQLMVDFDIKKQQINKYLKLGKYLLLIAFRSQKASIIILDCLPLPTDQIYTAGSFDITLI